MITIKLNLYNYNGQELYKLVMDILVKSCEVIEITTLHPINAVLVNKKSYMVKYIYNLNIFSGSEINERFTN